MSIVFFVSASEFRQWLTASHAVAAEIRVGFYRKESGRAGITYAEAVDEALCFGWIDGLRKRVDEVSYAIRFTPRKARSIWSVVNTKRVGELKQLGRLHAAGLKAFAARDPKRSGVYSFENETRSFDAAGLKQFRAHKNAWKFFQLQAPWYRRTATWWVVSAKKAETRSRRLDRLIADSEKGVRLAHLTSSPKLAK